MKRRIFLSALTGLALAVSVPAMASSDPVKLVVAFTAGGPVDIIARSMGEQLAKQLGRTVIVENRPGANGNIAAAYVAGAHKDGSVLFLTSVGAVAISGALYGSLSYDPAKDFAPVSRVVNNATVFVVNPNNPAVDAADFVKRSKDQKQPYAIGSSGIGSIPHLTLELFQDATGANVLHVPYKGASQVVNDVLGGHVDGFFGDLPGLINQIQAGKLKPLGVASAQPNPLLPNVKTLAEQGIAGVESNNWYGLLAPAGTPPETIAKLNEAVRATLSDATVRGRLEGLGAEVSPSSPEELKQLIEADTAKWSGLIKSKNIQPE